MLNSYQSLRDSLDELIKKDKKKTLSKKIPSIFIDQGDEKDKYVLSLNGSGSGNKTCDELLPYVRMYKRSLVNELRNAEYYIKYLEGSGCYPRGSFNIEIEFKEYSNE